MYDRMMTQIDDLVKDLNNDEELGTYLASFGREILVRISGIGYHNPYLIIFYGEELNNGTPVQLVQHVSQISVLFTVVSKLPGHEEASIGFQQVSHDK
jgi:Family of unknown function (DUF6173)